jgi:DNA-binding NarL/FixJ family response regulator
VIQELEIGAYDSPTSLWDGLQVRLDRTTSADSETVGSPTVNSLCALIADDARSTRRFLRAVLEHSRQFGVIREASDGDESVEMAKAIQPDVVLLDLAMPLAYGTNALRRIREVAPGATVIVVSRLDPALQMPTLEAGAVAFIPKGFTPLEFLARLEAILDRSLNLENRVGGDSIPSDPRAIVFADERVTRLLVSQVLDRCGALVIAETDNSSTLLEVVSRAKPEIIVLGLSVKGTHNIEVVPEVRRLSPSSAVVVYSAREKWKNKPLADDEMTFVLRPRVKQLVQKIEGIVKTPVTIMAPSEP